MPKRKASSVSKTQPSFKEVPPPDLKSARKSGVATALDAGTSTQPANAFIVDNSESDWNVARYLRDWCEIARAFDIATGYFEIGALLALGGPARRWRLTDRASRRDWTAVLLPAPWERNARRAARPPLDRPALWAPLLSTRHPEGLLQWHPIPFGPGRIESLPA